MEREENREYAIHQDEIIEFIKRAQKGDREALDIIVNRNLGLIWNVVKRFVNRGHDMEDLFQIGSIGLIKAVYKFNPDYDVKFSTYAVPMIIGEIKRFIRDDGLIKVSRSLKEMGGKIRTARNELANELNREPTVGEIAEKLNISTEDIVLALETNSMLEYLYDTIHQKDGSPVLLIDKIEDNCNEADIINKIALKDVIAKLNSKEKQIIFLRYFKDKTQMEVAKDLGISQVQVSRIEKKVLEKLRREIL